MASSGGSFYFPTQLRTPSFSDLLSDNEGSASVDQNIAETPELKSYSPPVSPSSYFSFLDSPAFMSNSNVIPSPSNEVLTGLTFKEQDINYSDFSLQPPKRHAISSLEESVQRQQEGWVFNEATNPNELPLPRITVKSESTPIRTFSQEFPTTQTNHYSQPSQYIREQKRSNDGYNWRKYGQKQVKGSENPRSYYKCSYPNCPTKKKVETNLDGHITEIVYKGGHNHPKPQSTRKSSANNSEISNQSIPLLENARIKAVATPDNSSVSFGEEDFDQASSIRKSGDDHENEPEAKRWKVDDENEAISGPGSKTVREPRIVVQTTSDIDILDDGYRWRKYGQKVVKGNPNPRSYYKCTSGGCLVRKHVERASNDMRAVITTYEGKHNHDIPASRGSGNYPVNRPLSNNGIAIIRPAAIPAQSNQITNYSNTFNNTRIPTTKTQSLFELEMLQRGGSYGFSGNSYRI